MTVLSVIISNIDLHRTSVCPAENYSPLIIDPDAMEALELSLKNFESVSGWRRKVNQRFSIIQDVELPGSNFLDTGPPNTLAESALCEEPFNRRISEALDSHTALYHDKVYLTKVFLYQVVKEGPDSRIGNYCRHDPSLSDPGGVHERAPLAWRRAMGCGR
jgi:hypothetical protein